MRYYIGLFITIGLLILLIFLLVNGNSKTNVPTTAMPLHSYANTNAEVRLTIDGPINANQNHRQVQITVNQNVVTFDQFRGYDSTMVNQQQFVNSVNAYSAFLYSLELNGFTEGNNSSALSNEQGHCALGDRYILELIQGGNNLERYWATSCPKVVESFAGNLPVTLTLFEAQVPNYQTLTKNISF
ncbi:MAG TPA: hypothetical protein VNG32_05255 [Candidatus Dormibacteraeota bacterium]|nr:hypothetical protein [Candidatus Dormibacteraeota bacterium]